MVTARRYRSSILMYSVLNSRTEDKVASYQVRIKQVIEILIKILVCQVYAIVLTRYQPIKMLVFASPTRVF